MILRDNSFKLAFMSFVATVFVVCIYAPITRDYGFSVLFGDFFGFRVVLEQL